MVSFLKHLCSIISFSFREFVCSEILGGYITTVLLFICILMRLPWSEFHQMSGPAVIRSSGCSHRNVAQNNKKEKEVMQFKMQRHFY